MNNYFKSAVFCLFALSLSSIQAIAQPTLLSSALEGHTFSYSIIEVESNNVDLLKSTASKLVTEATSNGAVSYALWNAADKPADAPFAGLDNNQMGIMLAWQNNLLTEADELSTALQSTDGVRMVSSRLFDAIYLPSGLELPTSDGFYVHREEAYSLDDVDDAIRLSKEAWVTWEPYWKVKVVGLFREINEAEGVINLNRIVWYPSYDAWLGTRNFSEEMESAVRFRERRTKLIPGSGIAIATGYQQ